MDPFTILAAAKAATEGIKKAISIGQDISAIVKDMSALMKAEGQLAAIAAKPPTGWGVKGSAEEIALQAVTARKQVEEMKAQIQNEIIGQYGLGVMDELHREIIKVRKQQKEVAEREAREREEQLRMIMFALPIVGIPLLILIIVIVAILTH